MSAVHEMTEAGSEGKYRVLVELGQGGTANVYLAVARGPSGFSKLVVLKALKKNLANDPDFRNMFLSEARLAARLNHPNVVQTYEVAEDQGQPVIVMEYLEGQPLSNILQRGRGGAFPLSMHLRAIADGLAGLQCAHELSDFDGTPLGVVHRDMTPHNLFVTFNGTVKILDFGIAKLGTSQVETQTGIIKGKLRYMPPEQIAGDRIDRRADIYAVGVMLWEAVAGDRMWKGESEPTIMKRVLNGEIPSPRTVKPDVSERLEAICMKALAVDPANRHASAAELEADIEAAAAELDLRVNNREIGKCVTALFEDVRLKTKSLVDTQLSKVATLSWAEYQASEAFAQLPTMTFSQQTGGASSVSGTDTVARPGRAAAANRMRFLVSAAVVLVLGLVFLARKGPSQSGAAPTPTPTSTQAPLPAPPPTAEEVRTRQVSVHITAYPASAKLYYDDEPVPSNPSTRLVAADGTKHVVRAEAQGFSPEHAELVLDKDSEVVLMLKRESGRARPHSAVPLAPVATPQTPTVARPNCDPPYFVDQRGIKKFKPECM